MASRADATSLLFLLLLFLLTSTFAQPDAADAQNDHHDAPHLLPHSLRLIHPPLLRTTSPVVVVSSPKSVASVERATLVTSESKSASPVAMALVASTSAIFTQTESAGEFISPSPSSNFVNFESTVKSSSKSTSSTSPSPFSPLHTASASDHLQADQPWFRCPPEATSTGKGCQLTAFPSSDPSTEKPVINPFLFGSNLREGMRTSVLCSVISGESPLTITWYKNLQPLESVHSDVEVLSLGEFTSNLKISSVKREHAGNYTCQAKSNLKATSASYSAEMVVQASPKWIIRPLDSYTVVQGRNLLIDCQTDGFPVPIHQWKKYRRTQIIPSPGTASSSSSLSPMSGSMLPSSSSLSSSSSSPSSSLSSSSSSSSSSSPLSSSSSSSSFHKSNAQVTAGTNPSKEFVSIVSGPHVHVLENGSLVIVEADKSDEGEYLCGSSNSIGTLVSSPVLVKVNTPAYFKKNFQLIKTRIGERVLLPCEAFGDEPIKLTWSRDGEILSNSNYSPRNKHIIQESAGGPLVGSLVSSRFSRLGIESVDLTDSAFYTCTASNPYGREELSVQLLVQGPPDPPVALKALEITGRRILIEWKHPSDGNSPIIEYTVNYRKNDVAWNSEQEYTFSVGPKESTATLGGLEPNTVYKVRLFAQNLLGKSPASDDLVIRTEEEAPSEMASSIRTESLSSRSIRVHWIVSSTVVSTASSSPSDSSYALHTSSPSSNSASQLIKRTFDGFYVGYREIEQLTSASPSSSVLVLSSTASKSPQSVYSFKTVDLSGPAVHQGNSSPSHSSSYSSLPSSPSSPSPSSSGSHLIKNDFQYTLTDLKRNTRYGIIVQAFNRKGPGPSSEEVVAITAEYDAPSAISVKVTTLDHHSLALSWESVDESDELVTPVTGYIISYKSHLDNWEELKMVGKRTSYVLENLRCGTKYQVTVVAYNKAGRSKPSELASAATAGNVPSAPSFDALIKSNSTMATIDLSAWSDNGCAIMYFVVQYKEHFQSDWIMLSNNIIPEQSKVVISDLVPSTWYDVSMVAHSEAGSTEAQYLFSTLTPTGGTISPLSVTSDSSWEVAIYDPVIIAPIICTCFVVIVVFATIAYFTASSRRIQVETAAMDNYSTIGSRKMESLSMNSLRFKVPSTSSHLASNLLATQANVGGTNGSGLMNRIVAEALAEDTSNGGDLSPNDAQVFMESKKIYDFVQQQQRHRDSTFATGYYSSPFATVNRSNVNSGNSSFTTGHHQSNLACCEFNLNAGDYQTVRFGGQNNNNRNILQQQHQQQHQQQQQQQQTNQINLNGQRIDLYPEKC